MKMNLEHLLELVATLGTMVVLLSGLVLGQAPLREKLSQSRALAGRWVVYIILDYGLMALSLVLVGVWRALGASFGSTTTAMFLLDLLAAGLLCGICLHSGQDLTQGREYRQSTTLLQNRAWWAGAAAFMLLLGESILWDGPERMVEYFHPEPQNRKTVAVELLAGLALVQALFWTGIYWSGFQAFSSITF